MCVKELCGKELHGKELRAVRERVVCERVAKPHSRRPSFFDPTKVASPPATPYIGSAPTSKNLLRLSFCKPSTTPSHGGRESLPLEHPHFEPLGL